MDCEECGDTVHGSRFVLASGHFDVNKLALRICIEDISSIISGGR